MNLKRYNIYLIIFLLSSFCVDARSNKKIKIFKTNEEIRLDGILDEKFWSNSEIASNFFQQFPNDSIPSELITEVRLAFTDKRLYLSGKMYDSVPKRYIVNSLKRDYQGPNNEAISITFDTYNDQKNALNFGVNPYGVQRESLIAKGGAALVPGVFNISWNTKWESYVKKYEDYWYQIDLSQLIDN